ncbi:MAG TPA: hypothetical protein VD866_26120 [Urbifossiella sp.]|nr:hypothetical protein [Urbifossiella sp.]
MAKLRCPGCGKHCVYAGDDRCEECDCELPPGFGRVPEAVRAAAAPADPFNPPGAVVPPPVVPPPVVPPPVMVPQPPAVPTTVGASFPCLSCRAPNDSGAATCANCGCELEVLCVGCKNPTAARGRFCGTGGKKCPPVADSVAAAVVGAPPVAAPPVAQPPVAQPPAQVWVDRFALVLLDPKGLEVGRFPLPPGDTEVGIVSPGDSVFPAIDLTPHDPGEVISRRMVGFRVADGRVEMVVRTGRGTVQLSGTILSQDAVVGVPVGADLRFAHLTARVVAG